MATKRRNQNRRNPPNQRQRGRTLYNHAPPHKPCTALWVRTIHLIKQHWLIAFLGSLASIVGLPLAVYVSFYRTDPTLKSVAIQQAETNALVRGQTALDKQVTDQQSLIRMFRDRMTMLQQQNAVMLLRQFPYGYILFTGYETDRVVVSNIPDDHLFNIDWTSGYFIDLSQDGVMRLGIPKIQFAFPGSSSRFAFQGCGLGFRRATGAYQPFFRFPGDYELGILILDADESTATLALGLRSSDAITPSSTQSAPQ